MPERAQRPGPPEVVLRVILHGALKDRRQKACGIKTDFMRHEINLYIHMVRQNGVLQNNKCKIL